jgi:O-antigen ligase
MIMAGEQPAGLSPHLPNHNITVLALMFWPAALLARSLDLLRAYRYAAAVAVALIVATVFASEHASSKVALIGGAAAFVLFRLRPRLAMPLMVAGWVGASLLVVPAVSLLYTAEAYRAEWLPGSGRERIAIWRYTSEQIPKAPILGAGMGAARATSHAEAETMEARRVPGTDFHLSTSVHSHNAYLQVWYETGAAGALIMLAVGLLILRALTSAPPRAQPYLAATFAACALMAAFAYSIWAPWYVASLGMAAIFVSLGTALYRERRAASL